MNEGVLYGVAGIDVIVNSSEAASAIQRRLINANVASIPLPCQMIQVEYLNRLVAVLLPTERFRQCLLVSSS